MEPVAIDHLVLTVRDLDASIDFYTRVLGMREIVFGEARRALIFGQQKLNLHLASAPFVPHAVQPIPGAIDLCLLVSTPMTDIVAELATHGVLIEAGPVKRTGARGNLLSIYVRDPDGNLIELSNAL